jgi:hypothetical protein
MARVFISYRREDSAGHAGRLYDRLAQHFGAHQLFMDVDTIEPGVDFVEVIQSAVGACDVLLAIIGKRWLTSADATGKRRLDNPQDFVRLEIEAALDRGIRVVPLLVHGAAMPRADELPDGLSRLARRNAFEVSDHRFRFDTEQLIATLERDLSVTPDTSSARAPGRPDTSRPALAPQPTKRRGLGRRPVLLGAGLLLGMGAVALALYLTTPNDTVLLEEHFADPSQGQLATSSPIPAFTVAYDAGEYVIRRIDLKHDQWPYVSFGGQYVDYSIAVDARLVSEPGLNRWLIVACRVQEQQLAGYRLRVNPSNRQFVLTRKDPELSEEIRLGGDWQVSPAIRPHPEANHLELTCSRNTISASVNGKQVVSVTDDRYRVGRTFIGIGSPGPGLLLEARFDNLRLTER